MTTVTFTYFNEPWYTGYKCDQPGEQSGEYVRADVARGLLAELAKAEWAGTIDNGSARDPAGAGCCPCCMGVDPAYPWPSRFPRATFGHTKDCTLRAAIEAATVKDSKRTVP